MKNQQAMGNNKKGAILTMIGVAIMILLTATKLCRPQILRVILCLLGLRFSSLWKRFPKHRMLNRGCVLIRLWRILKSRV